MRSSINYSSLLAHALNAKHTDLTVSSATLLNLLSEPQVMNGVTFPPQLQNLPSDADIVTVTGGGNDMGYIGGMIMESINQYAALRLMKWLASFFTPVAVLGAASEDETADRFGQVLDRIHSTAPNAKVLLVEYNTLLGTDAEPCSSDLPLTGKQIQKFRDMAASLQRAYAKAVKGRETWVALIPIAGESQHHGIGSEEPWVDGFSFGMMLAKKIPYHPNAAGMKAVESICLKVLREKGWVDDGADAEKSKL